MTTGTIVAKSASAARTLHSRFGSFASAAARILFFSLADDRVSFRKGCCIAIEKGSIAVASGKRFLSRVSIKAGKHFRFDTAAYPDPEACASSVSLAAAEFPMKRAEVVLSIPKAWTIVTTAEFPATIKENIGEAMRHELDRLTPFSHDEALYDFRVLRESEGKLSVLLIAAKASVVMPYIDALKNQGIAVSRVTSHITSLGAFSGFGSGLRDFVMLRDREDAYEGGLFLDGTVQNVFTVLKSELSAEQAQAALFQELDLVASSLQEHKKKPRIVLSSESSGTSVRDLLMQKTGMPVTPAEEILRKGAVPRLDTATMLSSQSGLIELLWPKAQGLDLFSRGRRQQRRQPLLLTGLLSCALIAAGLVLLYAPLEREKGRSAEIDRMIASKKEDVRKVEDLKKQVESLANEISTIQSFRRKKPLTVNLLREVTNVLPNNAWLTRLRISETQVDIEGFAGSATELIPKIEASKSLSKAELASPTYRDPRTNLDRFIIKAEIEGVKKDENAGGTGHEKK